ncbi:MAG: hypothetical protein PHR61_04325 [Candidatus Absconditabacteria bacterium]|nr:hypothetical protein [Candidatus Absconditabacteria bacterium]
MDIALDANHVSLQYLMSQYNNILEHQFSQGKSKNFVLQRLVKINQEAGDPRLLKLISFIRAEECFDSNWLKIAIAILLNLPAEPISEEIQILAYFHEKNVQKDERATFVSILLCEIGARKELILSGFDSLKLPSIVAKIEKPSIVQTSRGLDDSVDIEENYKPSRSKRKTQKQSKQVFILHKKEPEPNRPRPRKSGISSRQKIISVLEKEQSFLIYQEAFPLPSGIKRIRIKENFGQIVQFIESYIAQTHLPVEVVVEQDRAKVLFKKTKRQQKKTRQKTQIRVRAA